MSTKLANVTPVEVWMRLKDHRILRGQMAYKKATNRSLAAQVGCAHGMIGDLARGTKNGCSPALAHRIAAALGTTLEALFLVEASNDPGRNAKAKEIENRARSARRSAA